MKRRGWVVVAVALATPLVWTSGVEADGQPLAGFGVDGVLIDRISTASDAKNNITHVIGDDDGNLLVSAKVESFDLNLSETVLVRYLPNGHRDPSFGDNGVVVVATPAPNGQIDGLATLPTGSIVLSGVRDAARVFGHDGSVHLGGGANSEHLVEMPDGRVLAPNFHTAGLPGPMFTVIDPSGVLMPDAGDVDGLLGATGIGPTGAWRSANGSVIVSGFALTGAPMCILVAFDDSLKPDTSFGINGKVTIPPNEPQACDAAGLADGSVLVRTSATTAKIVDRTGEVIGDSTIPIPLQPFFTRTPIFASDGSGRLFVAQADGHAVTAYFADGSIDTTFGTAGSTAFTDGLLTGIHVLDTGNIALWGVDGGFGPTRMILKVVASPWGIAPQPPTVAASKFVPVAPQRILDTREGLGAPLGPIGPNGQIELQVTGVAGVPPTGVSAVVMNVTATQSASAGFVTAFPSGNRLPTVSNLNLDAVGQTAANLVTVKVGTNGKVSLYVSGGAHLAADIAGYYTPVVSARDGRLQTAAPERILDTRVGLGAPKAKLPAGGQIDLQITGNGPVPSSGVSAVVLNVTADQATADGFVTVWPTGLARPVVSNLNLVANETRPNLVIVPVGAGGRVSLFSQSGADLLADVAGWFTDGTAADSSIGLFVPITPTRVLDTRLFPRPIPNVGPAPGTPPGSGPFLSSPPTLPLPTTPASTVTRRVGSSTIIPPRASIAVATNITVTQSGGPGFITAWPAHTPLPIVSNLNSTRAGQTIPNAAIVPLGQDDLSLFTQSGAHLIVDVHGWYTNS